MPEAPPAASPGFCGAPSSTLHVAADGVVTPCAPNTTPLGHLADGGLVAAWHGAERRALDAAVDAGDCSRGCDACAVRLLLGHLGAPPLAYPTPSSSNGPTVLELEPDAASGPAQGFDERFYAEVADALAGLRRLRLGGPDPSAAEVARRVAALVPDADASEHLDVDLEVPAHALAPELTRLVADARASVALRLPAATADLFESIDPTTRFSDALAAADDVLALVRRSGGRARLVFDLRRETWPDLGEVLRRADGWDLDAEVRTDHGPARTHLDALPPALLADVAASLRRQDQALGRELARNRPAWEAACAHVDQLSRAAGRHGPEDARLHLAASFPATGPAPEPAADDERHDGHDGPDDMRLGGQVRCDLDDVITWATRRFVGIDGARLVGRPFHEVGPALDRLLHVAAPSGLDRAVHGDVLHWRLHYDSHPRPTTIQATTRARRAPDGRLTGTYTDALLLPHPPGSTSSDEASP